MPKETRKITLRLVLSWFFGIIFGIAGLSSLFTDSFIAGSSLIIASLILLPPVTKFSKKKFNFELSGGLKITLVIILLVIYGITAFPSDSSSNSQSSMQDVALNNVTEPISETKTYSLGDTIIVDNFAYTFTNLQKKSYVGTEYFGDSADGIFLIFNLEVNNLGNGADYINNEIYILDNQGREFSQDDDSWIYLDDNFIFEELNPGLTKKGQIIFDIPKNVDGTLCIKVNTWSSDCFALISYP